MNTIMGISPYIGLAIPAIAAAVFYYRYTLNHPRPNTITNFRTGPECLKIIEGSCHPDGRKNNLSEHEARALENETIKRVFGTRNAFTTTDKDEAKRFVQGVARLMKLTDTGWDRLRCVLYRTGWDTVNMLLATSQGRVNLASVTQVLALQSSLCVFFHMTGEVDDERLLDLAAIIHKTWVDMKSKELNGKEPVKDIKDNHDFQTALSAVFPGRDILDPRSNPLNLILPSFETVWRVALRLFMELHRRDNQEEISTLISFAQKPADAQFKTESYENKISAKFLVKEALRLYPPSRRIRRAYWFSNTHSPVTCTADVEACQTDTKTWGEDAMQFKPERWKKAGVVQDLSFLAFGGRPFLCPASQDFGLRVIGLITGVLLDVFRDGWVLELDDVEERRGLKAGERLSNERDAYGGVFLAIS